MIKTGYDARLSAGAIAAGGTLGILIPPSVMLVVMGPTMGVPVNLLYSAAFGPGFVLAGMYIVYCLTRSFFNPALGPPVPPEERVGSVAVIMKEVLIGVLPLVALIGFTLGTILGAGDADGSRLVRRIRRDAAGAALPQADVHGAQECRGRAPW